jgi:hypothetical protein
MKPAAVVAGDLQWREGAAQESTNLDSCAKFADRLQEPMTCGFHTLHFCLLLSHPLPSILMVGQDFLLLHHAGGAQVCMRRPLGLGGGDRLTPRRCS